jgi:hypothetical protein
MNEEYKNDPTWKYHQRILIDAGNVWKSSENLTKEEEIFFYKLTLEALREKTKIEDIYNF